MQLHNPEAEIYVPDGAETTAAIARTTHAAIGAHPDDIPVMALHGVTETFGRDDRWLLAITVTDGAGSPRTGAYADATDEQMRLVRRHEERTAAALGGYGAAALLDYSSVQAKLPTNPEATEDLAALLAAATPKVVYTHNLADKHDTHVAVALRTIAAIRSLDAPARPAHLYGCEVWRDLDWLVDADKVSFDVGDRPHLGAAMIGVYDSQIAGGKRYDLAAAGRRLANATFSASHEIDAAQELIIGMDLTPLITDERADPASYVAAHLDRTRSDIVDRISRLDPASRE